MKGDPLGTLIFLLIIGFAALCIVISIQCVQGITTIKRNTDD